MKPARVAVNGFGRIGRAFVKLAIARPELQVVAVNDLGDPEMLAYLLKYDSAYGRFKEDVHVTAERGKTYLNIDGKAIVFLQEKDPLKLPWRDLAVDIVIEATGAFESFEKAAVHREAGAKRVVLTAPAKDDDTPEAKTVLMGVNSSELRTCELSSNGSCTTNSIGAVMQVLVEKIGVKKAFLNTVHAYTATQNLIDGPVKGKDFRRGRAAAANIVPSTTGAAIAVGRVVEGMKGKFDGIAVRVPSLTGSLSAITFLAKGPTMAEAVNRALEEAEKEPRWKGILRTTRDQIVSTDIVGDPHAAIVDLSLTKVVDGDLCAVYSWYDNEMGYTYTLVDHVAAVAKTIS